MTPAQLGAVADVGERDELAAITHDDRRDLQPAPGDGGDESGGKDPVSVKHVCSAAPPDRPGDRGVLAAEPSRPAEVVHRGANQAICTRPVVIPEHVHRHVVAPGQALEQREQRRNDPFASAFVDPPGDDPCDPHG